MDKDFKQPIAVVLAVGATGLAVFRSLATAKIPTIGIVATNSDPCYYSRHPIKTICLEDQNIELSEALSDLPGKGYCLIPTSDLHVEFIVEHYEALSSSFIMSCSSKETLNILLDKARESKAIADLGLNLPKTWLFSSSQEANEAKLDFPVIVKARRNNDNPLKAKNRIVKSQEDWQKLSSQLSDEISKLIIQEIIPGNESSLWINSCTFDKKHSLVSIFSFQRLSAAPKLYGVTSHAISRQNKQLEDMCRVLGDRLKITGNADIEFKKDERNGNFKYIEINPRIGMCGWFDTRSGVNNILNGYYIAIDKKKLINNYEQKDGVILLDLYEDTYAKIKAGVSLLQIFISLLRHILKRHASLYFSIRDPIPALVVYKKNILALIRSFGKKTSKLKKNN